VATSFAVLHPDYLEKTARASALPADVVVSLPDSCIVTGTVTDGVTWQSAAGALITARRVDEWKESFTATDDARRFRLAVPEGRHNFLAEAKDGGRCPLFPNRKAHVEHNQAARGRVGPDR